MKERIVFLGTVWCFTSCECLTKLIDSNINIVAVICIREREIFKNFINNILYFFLFPQKRNLIRIARVNNIPFLLVEDINSSQTIEKINSYYPDLICAAIFGQKLKKEILMIPKYGSINFHPSLLPKYKGPNPYFWVIKNAEKKTGITIHYMDEGLDTGDILLQELYQIKEGMDIIELQEELGRMGSHLLVSVIMDIFNGDINRIQQEGGTKYSTPIRSDYSIDINMNVRSMFNFIKSIKSMQPDLVINDHTFTIRDAINFEICNHDKFLKYEIKNGVLTYFGKDGVINLKLLSPKQRILNLIDSIINLI